ncbi:hypothetical protein [Paenisporosarcina sp. TG20]|uniref:hypothetical protein n=1 Tax=Paenisporosarcina sp. TG20 TaxID=1211706 RepID=UPI0003063F99|nr:hypothetical protein [Paenisporosarcina sp. TG20]
MEQHHPQHQQGHMKSSVMESEIKTTLTYRDSVLQIRLEDNEGKAPELTLTHEKYMHVIVVSKDLDEFYHVHPERIDKHTYEINLPVTGQSYKAFIDINPNGKQYLIEPNSIEIQNHIHTHSDSMKPLKVDKERVKEVRGKTVELNHDSFVVGNDVNLSFDTKGAKLSTYLGALGHVVIIDAKVEKFIHVHPISENETSFVAHFEEEGIYKLWAEFKFGQEVIAFPYIIEVGNNISNLMSH